MNGKKSNPRIFAPITSKSAETIGSVDDLFTQILVKVPIKSLIRFKSVCKPWLAVITDPQFFTRCRVARNPFRGIYVSVRSRHRFYDYIPIFSDDKFPAGPPINLDFSTNPSETRVLQSCNGLLLLSRETYKSFYVYNPATNCVTTLPDFGVGYWPKWHGVVLVFNPIESPYYKIVTFRCRRARHFPSYEVYIYSSDTKVWKRGGLTGNKHRPNHFGNGVYCNGSVHWLFWVRQLRGDVVNMIRFRVDTLTLEEMPIPPPLRNTNSDVYHFGESCDYLQFFIEDGLRQLTIYEMKRDYSKWFVKYRVDFSCVIDAYPHRRVDVLSLVRGEEDKDSILVLKVGESKLGFGSKAVKFNIVDGTFERLHDLDNSAGGKAFSYIPTLCHV